MKTFREELRMEVPSRRGIVNITADVARAVQRSGVEEGLCLVSSMHTTSSVYVNDDESGLFADLDAWLEALAPHAPTSRYAHNRTGEQNADAHLKREVLGRAAVLAISGGTLDLGPWEQVFYAEFDGLRKKRVLVKVVGE